MPDRHGCPQKSRWARHGLPPSDAVSQSAGTWDQLQQLEAVRRFRYKNLYKPARMSRYLALLSHTLRDIDITIQIFSLLRISIDSEIRLQLGGSIIHLCLPGFLGRPNPTQKNC